MTVDQQLELIRRGVAEVISEAELRAKLERSEREHHPLRIKAGFDPTAPDLHLGHTVLLRKLRQFQDLGHRVIFLIGDATALVGDPSGQSKMRKLMTDDEVSENALTYQAQIERAGLKIHEHIEVCRNSEWFGKGFGLKEFVELASKYSVARLLERDDFQKRMKAGQEVSMLELFYPLMQGYDSVQLKADVELGGTDQKFNLLVGRDLQRAYGQEPQVVITMPLLEGTDGVQKMSKSLGNHIGINEPPEEMFGKLMSIPDALIVKYFMLLTDRAMEEILKIEQQMTSHAINPRDVKVDLAKTIVARYHSAEAAEQASAEFSKVFSRREPPSTMPTALLRPDETGQVNLVDLLVSAGLAKTNNEARRLVRQGAVKLNGQPLARSVISLSQAAGATLQVGSRYFRKLVSQ